MLDEYESLRSVTGPVSRETFQLLKGIQTDLLYWNASINLISSSTVADVWHRHILDSAQLFNLMPVSVSWLDLGSGGGFPGLIIAALMRERPGAEIRLVESNRKKCAFLQTMVGKYDLPARVHAVRIEQAPKKSVEVVSARALAPLTKLLDYSAYWLERDARSLFHKGRDYSAEVAEAVHKWSFDLIEHRSAVDTSGVILEISKLRLRK